MINSVGDTKRRIFTQNKQPREIGLDKLAHVSYSSIVAAKLQGISALAALKAKRLLVSIPHFDVESV